MMSAGLNSALFHLSPCANLRAGLIVFRGRKDPKYEHYGNILYNKMQS